MSDVGAKISLLERREVEAKIVGPLIRAFREELGEEKTLEVLRRVVSGLARESGAALAREFAEATLPAFASCLDRWKEGGALKLTILEQGDDRLSFDVTRCRYAELYKDLGLGDLGFSLSCVRDFALVEGFNPEITLRRTQTMMEGASHCDFRFHRKSPADTADLAAEDHGSIPEAASPKILDGRSGR